MCRALSFFYSFHLLAELVKNNDFGLWGSPVLKLIYGTY